MDNNEGKEQKNIEIDPTADNGLAYLGLMLATVTARLATVDNIIKRKNQNLAGVMTYVKQLKYQGNEIERTMQNSKKDYKHLIDVYKKGLETTQHLLRQAMI